MRAYSHHGHKPELFISQDDQVEALRLLIDAKADATQKNRAVAKPLIGTSPDSRPPCAIA